MRVAPATSVITVMRWERSLLAGFSKRLHLGTKSFRRRAQRIVREIERHLQTGYKTGYEMRLAD